MTLVRLLTSWRCAVADTRAMPDLYKRHRFPPGHHRLCGVAILPVCTLVPQCRKATGFRGRSRQLRSRAAMCSKFGPEYAERLRPHRRRIGRRWLVEEACIRINGTAHYLSRAVDQN